MSIEASSTVTLPFGSLYISQLNVRKETDDPELPELIASIKAHGVLDNLVVHPEPPTSRKSRKTKHERFGVVSGGRRWRALAVLHEQGFIDDSYSVVCKICSYEDAIEISLAANMFRIMHPADQFEAFKELIDAGRSVEEVAARFGVTPLVIQRRLRLANLHPIFLPLYREGTVDLDQLMALAITDDHARQQQAWSACGGVHSLPQDLRRALTDTETSSETAIARFVGVEAYVAAGGAIRSDLFSDVGEMFLLDRPLLEKLAKEKLDAYATQLKADGAAWVDILPAEQYWRRGDYTRVPARQRTPTEAEQAQEEALSAEIEDLEQQMEEAADDEELFQQCEARRSELESLQEARLVPDPEQLKAAGTLLSINPDGSLRVEKGYLRNEDAKRIAAAERRAAREDSTNGEPRMPAALLGSLTAHRTAALQVELARQPDLALAALLHRFLSERCYGHVHESPVQITWTDTSLRAFADDMETSRAFNELAGLLEKMQAQMPEEVETLWEWVRARSTSEQLALLAVCIAPTINGATTQPRYASSIDFLADAVQLDMRKWWSVSTGYLKRIQKKQILEAVREGVSPEAAAPLEPLKKEALVESAQRQLAATGWLPLPLRATRAA
ncbi:DNA-binding protein [Steroidobacter agaridevorans]|uniref:DNA-binding protein n=1 Tax=Steroidobacter agaridevorans TaxID=2695856 RepID=A0A829YGW2_9GAMM|nr:ParB/Srx family N-terminal domain-containing protein [Steroidobacter agaridevorans]GFE82484.1 DNA-binding protein [Steroidobacter agaridevorans]